jgi:hypothetical protein
MKEVREEVLSRAGAYREVHAEGKSSKDPSPLKVKEVAVNGRRYMVCLNPRPARKDKDHRCACISLTSLNNFTDTVKDQLNYWVRATRAA